MQKKARQGAFLALLTLLGLTACGRAQSVQDSSLTDTTTASAVQTTTSAADTQTETTAEADTETQQAPDTTGAPDSTASADTTGSTAGTQSSSQHTAGSSQQHQQQHQNTQPAVTQPVVTQPTAPQSSHPASAAETTVQTQPAQGITTQINGVNVVDYGTDHPRAIEVFWGNKNVAKLFADAANTWKERLGAGVNVWAMPAPSSQAVYQPADVAVPNGTQDEIFSYIQSNLSGVTGIPLVYTMAAHKDEPIYSRTDYHWFPLGAYYAGSVFAQQAGVPYAPLNTYEAVTRTGYVGAFYRVNKVNVLADYPETFTYYKPANLAQVSCTYYDTAYRNPRAGSLLKETLPIGSSYQIFGGTDNIIYEVNTNAGTGRTLVIFKDSFGNALVPFLTHSFDKIVVCDFRYFDIDPIQFIKNEGATDLLFCMTTSNIMTRSKTQNLFDMLS